MSTCGGPADINAFYTARPPVPRTDATLLVLSEDGKSVVMRSEGCATMRSGVSAPAARSAAQHVVAGDRLGTR
jgi:hypothetical protein